MGAAAEAHHAARPEDRQIKRHRELVTRVAAARRATLWNRQARWVGHKQTLPRPIHRNGLKLAGKIRSEALVAPQRPQSDPKTNFGLTALSMRQMDHGGVKCVPWIDLQRVEGRR